MAEVLESYKTPLRGTDYSKRSFDLETQGEYGGHRIIFRSGVGEVLLDLRRAQIVNLDIGTGDPIVPALREIQTPFLLGGGLLSWQVYPVETTVAEKLHALIARGSQSSRAKDIFDLALLIPKCDPNHLRQALAETFRYRGEKLPRDIASHIKDIDLDLLKKGWNSAVGEVQEKMGFEQTYDKLVALLADLRL